MTVEEYKRRAAPRFRRLSLTLPVTMGPLWRVLATLLVCAAAQDLIKIEAELGRDLTLNCSLKTSTIFWYMEINSQVTGCIAHVIDTDIMYWVKSSMSKYEATINHLVIRNVSVEDCRLYFCGRRINTSIHFEKTFRVVSSKCRFSQIFPLK